MTKFDKTITFIYVLFVLIILYGKIRQAIDIHRGVEPIGIEKEVDSD